jgi:hypothetical protein
LQLPPGTGPKAPSSFLPPAAPRSKRTGTMASRSAPRRILRPATIGVSPSIVLGGYVGAGARLKTEGSLTVADTFELIIEVDGWRSGSESGCGSLGRPARWRLNECRWSTCSSLPPHRPFGASRNHDVWPGSLPALAPYRRAKHSVWWLSTPACGLGRTRDMALLRIGRDDALRRRRTRR